MDSTSSLTRMLNAAAAGDRQAAADLFPRIYDELRAIARARIGHVRPDDSLPPTALVNEVYLRLFGNDDTSWNSRGHFFGTAAQAMRNILVEHARRRSAQKRGGDWARAAEDDWAASIALPADDVLALDEAIQELERSDPQKSRLVLLHCFGGLSLPDTAAAMGLSLSTIEREWRFTRAILRARLRDFAPESPADS